MILVSIFEPHMFIPGKGKLESLIIKGVPHIFKRTSSLLVSISRRGSMHISRANYID